MVLLTQVGLARPRPPLSWRCPSHAGRPLVWGTEGSSRGAVIKSNRPCRWWSNNQTGLYCTRWNYLRCGTMLKCGRSFQEDGRPWYGLKGWEKVNNWSQNWFSAGRKWGICLNSVILIFADSWWFGKSIANGALDDCYQKYRGEGNRNLALAGTTSKAQRLGDKKPNTTLPHHYNTHIRNSILIMWVTIRACWESM